MCSFLVTANCSHAGDAWWRRANAQGRRCSVVVPEHSAGYCVCPGREAERLSPVGCGHAPFTCKSVCRPKVAIVPVLPGAVPAEIRVLAERHLHHFNATRILAEKATLRAHGRTLQLFAAAGDGILSRIADEFSDPSRYRTDRINSGQGVVVDIGCNIGDFAISAWKQNSRLHILCIEPMPVTYAFLIWNLLANGVPRLSPRSFGVAGAVGGASCPFERRSPRMAGACLRLTQQ